MTTLPFPLYNYPELAREWSSLTDRTARAEAEVLRLRGLLVYCNECHSAAGEECTDRRSMRCEQHAGRTYAARHHDEGIVIVSAPGDRCGGSGVLPNDQKCPGCRACS